MYVERSVSTQGGLIGNLHADTTTMGLSVKHKEGNGLGQQATDGFGSKRINTKHHRLTTRRDYPPIRRWLLITIHLKYAGKRKVARP